MRVVLPVLLLCLAPATQRLAAQDEPRHLLGQASSSVLDSLRLFPGDVLRVEIWREGDLSGEFPVDPTGTVTLPLLGPQPASSMRWPEFRERLMEAYREQLKAPSIVLTPLRQVFVLGEVNQPGLYFVDPTVTLAGAVARAGGASPQGDLRRMRLVREGRTIVDELPVEDALFAADVRSRDQIFVGRRSWFERNSSFLITAALSVTSIIVSLTAN